MMRNLPSLDRLVRRLQKIPYLASKNIYKVAGYFIGSQQQVVDEFCAALKLAQQSIKPCKKCFHWAEGSELCSICQNQSRNQRIVCVVETSHDLFAIEKAGGFDGVYHVLGGALCPLNGIGPDHLMINALLERAVEQAISEIIFATNPTPEGEATASYISSKLTGTGIAISKLASGMPIGSSLEYMDRVTIFKALSGRRPF